LADSLRLCVFAIFALNQYGQESENAQFYVELTSSAAGAR